MTRSEPTDPDQQSTPSASDESAAASVEPVETEALAVAKKEAADNYDRYVRVAADLENFRRRRDVARAGLEGGVALKKGDKAVVHDEKITLWTFLLQSRRAGRLPSCQRR